MLQTISKAVRLYRFRRTCPAVCVNSVDPITQEAVADICTPIKLYFGPTRAFVCLDAVAAAEYVMATGDTKNTITRQEMNAAELRRLDKATRGKCNSVLACLASAKAKAANDAEHAQLCQAMETEPAEIWSVLMGMPFTETPHLAMLQVNFAVSTYSLLLREYSLVSAVSARQVHLDNVRNLTALDVTCGDRVLYTRIKDLLDGMDALGDRDYVLDVVDDDGSDNESVQLETVSGLGNSSGSSGSGSSSSSSGSGSGSDESDSDDADDAVIQEPPKTRQRVV